MPSPLIGITLLACAACTPAESSGSGDSGSGDTTRSAPSSADAAPPPTPGAANTWTVTPLGIGPIRVGMTADELRGAAGPVELPPSPGSCVYVHPGAAPAGVLVMLADGYVARIDVDSAGVRTADGFTIGDSATQILRAYGARVTTTPSKYVPGGQVLTVAPAPGSDSAGRLVFETERGRVTRFRAGRLPEVGWVERCG